jgi:hypothetical protein
MKHIGITLIVLLCASLFGNETRLSPRFRTVYLLEMPDALDQHIASRLSNTGVLWVVLDPSSADAVITDNVNGAFWTWLQRTYPTANGKVVPDGLRESAPLQGAASASKHRGTVFLVDPRKRLVLWSTYEMPRNGSPGELDHVASRITSQLRSAFGKQ